MLTLELARLLNRAGHEVFVAESAYLHVSRFSRAVKKAFTVPRPRFEPQSWVQALVKIVEDEGVDMVIPSYEEILYLAQRKDSFPASCTVFCADFEKLITLHNKWLFVTWQQALGFDAPDTLLIRKTEELEQLDPKKSYALKASYSRASTKVYHLKAGQKPPPLDIEPSNPWIAQEWLEGKKYCTYGICQNGKLLAHAIYPVQFAIDGHSCLTFEAVEHPGILDWVTRFVEATEFTGQIAFDFVDGNDGRLLSIECNPRGTSGVHLFCPQDRIDQAFFNERDELLLAKPGRSKQIIMGMLMYGWKQEARKGSLRGFWRTLFGVRDVVFDSWDPLPCLAQPFVSIIYVWQAIKHKTSLPALFTYDLNWDGTSEEESQAVGS